MQTLHIFQQSGLGAAPFRFVTSFSFPSPSLAGSNPRAYAEACREAANIAKTHGVHGGVCQHCGMMLMNNFIVASSDGRKFVVGCDCVRKTGDLGLTLAVEKAERARVKAQTKARKASKAAAARLSVRAVAKVSRIKLLADNRALLVAAWGHRRDAFVRSVLRQGLAKGALSQVQLDAMQRWLDNTAAKSAKDAAEAIRISGAKHVGSVGARLRGVRVKCVARIVGGDPFNPWVLKLLRTDDGCTLSTFGNCTLDVDAVAVIDCTVKDHRSNKRTNEPETSIARLKIKELA